MPSLERDIFTGVATLSPNVGLVALLPAMKFLHTFIRERKERNIQFVVAATRSMRNKQ